MFAILTYAYQDVILNEVVLCLQFDLEVKVFNYVNFKSANINHWHGMIVTLNIQ